MHHLASWAGFCPGSRESGGRRMSGPTRKANSYVSEATDVSGGVGGFPHRQHIPFRVLSANVGTQGTAKGRDVAGASPGYRRLPDAQSR